MGELGFVAPWQEHLIAGILAGVAGAAKLSQPYL